MGAKLPEKILVWDTETSGTDVENDRILTCYAMLQNRDGSIERDWSWTIDPGIEVPEGAAAVHGMTTEWIRENGRKDWSQAIMEIAKIIGHYGKFGTPVAAFNLRYDLSILHNELIRGGYLRGVSDMMGSVYYDPFVHDRLRGDPYRRGKRRLVDLCGVYGIDFDESEAHDARYDVFKTGDLAYKLLSKERALTVDKLMPLLAECKSQHDESLEAYFAKSGKLTEGGDKIRIDRGWPLVTEKGN